MGYKVQFSNTPDIVICGSILGFNKNISKTTKIWGVGFHFKEEFTHLDNQYLFYAVRGKLTLNKLKTNSIIALGDPGLLLSRFFKPETQKQYDICIIAHYIDYKYLKKNYGDKYIIINMATNNIEKIANSINKCNFILSSSLHGIIFSHSLGIPAVHLENKILASKKNFKFKDYYSNLNIPYIKEDLKKENLDCIIQKYKKNRFQFLPEKKIINQIQDRLLFSFPYQKMNNIICTIVNNENKEINNWCIYHLKMGFDNIYIFYNNRKYIDYIGNFIDNKIKSKVHFHTINNKKISNKLIYNNFYNKFKNKFKWCAFFDLDKYIVLDKSNNINEFLNSYITKNVFIIRLKNQKFRNTLLMKIPYKQQENFKKQKKGFLINPEKAIIKGGIY